MKIQRRRFLKECFSGVVAGGLVTSSVWGELEKVAREKKLNLLFIMSDQHNADALGCYGNPDIQTPHIDRLASRGMRFENAFCQSPICCPSRMTILTGRYAHSHGVIFNQVEDTCDETTIAELCREAGYQTAAIGKMHLMTPAQEHGFDYVVDRQEFGRFRSIQEGGESFNKGWKKRLNLPLKKFIAGVRGEKNQEKPMSFWADQTIQFMRQNQDQPFCAWCSFYGPHQPINPSDPWGSMYDPAKISLPKPRKHPHPSPLLKEAQERFHDMTEEDHRRVLALYYGLVSQIDHNIGRVLQALETLGLADRTIVVYTSDHGESMSKYGAWLKKTGCFDMTVQVPLIIRLPGVSTAGKVSDALVGLIDLMPTFCDLMRLPVPSKVQGWSLAPLLKGETDHHRDIVFSELGYPGQDYGYFYMGRTQHHKYIWQDNEGQGFEELYDLQQDPYELINQVNNPQYTQILADLKQRVKVWNETTDHASLRPLVPRDQMRSHPLNTQAVETALGNLDLKIPK